MKVLKVIFFLTFVESIVESDRKITSFKNPECQICENSTIIIYVKAEGHDDTLHYLWGVAGKPSVFLALTASNVTLKIDWNTLLSSDPSGSINFSGGQPLYTFGVVINKLLEYNDLLKNASLDRETGGNITEWNTKYFSWNLESLSESSVNSKGTSAKISGSYRDEETNTTRGGIISLTLNCYGFVDHSNLLPHLLHTENTTQVDIILDGLQTEYENSRFALELFIASSDQRNHSMKIEPVKSLNDEHTPGVFTVIDLFTPSSSNFQAGGFLQWRPVSYTSRERDISDSTDAKYYNLTTPDSPTVLLNDTLLYAYYGYELLNSVLVQGTNISFGIEEDGYYKESNYTTWTFMVGYGKPLDDKFSLLVILVISIGLGVPSLLIVIGGVYVCVRKISENKDDLFSSS